jgi:hypothetical protein
MRHVQYIHARPHASDWILAKHDHALGDVFHSVSCRQLINAEVNVWEIQLHSGQKLPAHFFPSQTVRYFTAGSVSIGGERECAEGDVRWADGNVASGSWKVASLGARFYLIGMNGTPQAADGGREKNRALAVLQSLRAGMG